MCNGKIMNLDLRVRIVNESAARAFRQAYDQAMELAQDQPWNQELKQIVALMEEARRGLGVDRHAG